MSKRVLITGGCGFIGSNLVRYILRERQDWAITNLDALTYAGDSRTLDSIEGEPRYRFIQGSVCNHRDVHNALSGVDTVIHLAAESHVDRSISGPSVFIQTNVIGTQVLARCAADAGVGLFLHASTDEVYGPGSDAPGFCEDAPLLPSSPYAASKASSESVVHSSSACWGLPVIITRSTNNYGPWQNPEKLIPRAITNVIRGEQIPVYGDGLHTRDWIHVEDHCRAMIDLVERGSAGQTYNIGGGKRLTNMEVATLILNILGEDESRIKHVADRLGHDRGYSIDSMKIRETLGWDIQHDWAEGLHETVGWYLTHGAWWRELIEPGR